MSTDPTEVAESACDCFGIAHGTCLEGSTAFQIVADTARAVCEIWKSPNLQFYTDHTVSHSIRICQLLSGIREVEFGHQALSQKECVAFAVAALMHDIGMQFGTWGMEKTRDGGEIFGALGLTDPRRMSADEIRKQHIKTGSELVRGEIQGKRNWECPPPFASDDRRVWDFLGQCMWIAFAHSELDGSFWPDLLDPENQNFAEPVVAGTVWRPRLVAMLLRLIDELDGSKTRVGNPARVSNPNFVSQESEEHWYRCLLTSRVSAHNREGRLTIEVVPGVPDQCPEGLLGQVIEFVEQTRVEKIRREVSLLNTTARELKCRYNIDFDVTFISRKPPILWSVKLQEVEQFFEKRRNRPAARLPQALAGARDAGGSSRSGCDSAPLKEPPHDGAPAPPAKISSSEALRPRFERVADGLSQWLVRNKLPRHIELVSGTHTNQLVKCRSLMADPTLVGEVAAAAVEYVRDQEVDLVIGVGTSAIPIAAHMSLRLGCDCSFTFYQYEQDARKRRHSRLEIQAVVPKETLRHILFVDDIISAGATAEMVISDIEPVVGQARLSQARLTWLALFRLGDVEILGRDGLHYCYFCHDPAVYYARNKQECRYCLGDGVEQTECVHESHL